MEAVLEVSDLVRGAVGGDAGAWDALVDRYRPLVLSVIRSFRLREQDADDVHQTVWLRLVEHLGDLREARALPGWLVTTTRNECMQVLRQSRRTFPFDPLTEGDVVDRVASIDLDEDMLRAERHLALLTAFAEVSDHQRDLLMLLVEDPPLAYVDISRRLGIPLGSIGPTRARALRKIRDCPAIVAILEANRELDDNDGGDPRGIATLGRR